MIICLGLTTAGAGVCGYAFGATTIYLADGTAKTGLIFGPTGALIGAGIGFAVGSIYGIYNHFNNY